MPMQKRREHHKAMKRFHAPKPVSTLPAKATKERATGAAICWQGYSMREGFGTTRIRNQTKAANPNRGKNIFRTTFFLFTPTIRPLFGQVLKNHFLIVVFIIYQI